MSDIYYSQLAVNERELKELDFCFKNEEEIKDFYKEQLINGFSDSLKKEMKFEFQNSDLAQPFTKIARAEVAILPAKEYLRLKGIENMFNKLMSDGWTRK